MQRKRGQHVRTLLVALVLAGALAGVATLALAPAAPPPILGMVRTTEIDIQPEVSGRVAALPFRAGDAVKAGAVLAELSNPELAAAVEQAQAAVGVAQATRDHVYAGVRQEEVNMTAAEVGKAQANLLLAQQELTRISALASHGNATLQDLDNARANESAAAANLRVTQSNYAQAKRGPTAEDRALADANVTAAKASLTVLQRRTDKLTLRAPMDGVIEVVVAELGEAEIPGRTVLTLSANRQLWFAFNIREDQLAGLDIGAPLTLSQAGGNQIGARVTEMRRLGDFATWRAARAVGDHDLNTFAVRADPVGATDGVAPGMTVWIAGR